MEDTFDSLGEDIVELHVHLLSMQCAYEEHVQGSERAVHEMVGIAAEINDKKLAFLKLACQKAEQIETDRILDNRVFDDRESEERALDIMETIRAAS